MYYLLFIRWVFNLFHLKKGSRRDESHPSFVTSKSWRILSFPQDIFHFEMSVRRLLARIYKPTFLLLLPVVMTHPSYGILFVNWFRLETELSLNKIYIAFTFKPGFVFNLVIKYENTNKYKYFKTNVLVPHLVILLYKFYNFTIFQHTAA